MTANCLAHVHVVALARIVYRRAVTVNEFWARMGLSAFWFTVLEVVNALLPGGHLPHWLAVVLGLVAGFLGTFVFLAIWEGGTDW